jgi:hypothetical protein
MAKVYLDGDFDAPICEYSGDCQEGANNYASMIHIGQSRGSFDDYQLNSITMSYSGGSGTIPSVGDTITDDGTAATAIITAIEGDNVAGKFWLRNVLVGGSTEWSGKQSEDPFGSTTVSSGGWSASIDGLDMNSGLPGDIYFYEQIQPNGDVGGSIELDGSDGNQVDNYLQVQENPLDNDETDYNSTDTAGRRDQHDFPDFGVPANGIDTVVAVVVGGWVRKDGSGIENVAYPVKFSGESEDDGDDIALGTDYAYKERILEETPSQNPLSRLKINGMQAGGKFNS